MRQGMTLVCCAVLAACGSSTTSGEVFHANMNAAQEVPAPNVAGFNPVGTAVFQNNGDGSVTYTVNATGLSTSVSTATSPTTFTGMHIHFAAPGVASGVVVPLTTPSLGATAGVVAVTGTFTQASITGKDANNATITLDTVLSTMRSGGAYINVHTSKNQQGELRGQIATGAQ